MQAQEVEKEEEEEEEKEEEEEEEEDEQGNWEHWGAWGLSNQAGISPEYHRKSPEEFFPYGFTFNAQRQACHLHDTILHDRILSQGT